MKPVNEFPMLPQRVSRQVEDIGNFADTLILVLTQIFAENGFRINRLYPKDGSEPATNPLLPREYTTATRPTASDWEGGMIYVSDGAAGSKFQGSDGTSWVSLG